MFLFAYTYWLPLPPFWNACLYFSFLPLHSVYQIFFPSHFSKLPEMDLHVLCHFKNLWYIHNPSQKSVNDSKSFGAKGLNLNVPMEERAHSLIHVVWADVIPFLSTGCKCPRHVMNLTCFSWYHLSNKFCKTNDLMMCLHLNLCALFLPIACSSTSRFHLLGFWYLWPCSSIQ